MNYFVEKEGLNATIKKVVWPHNGLTVFDNFDDAKQALLDYLYYVKGTSSKLIYELAMMTEKDFP